MRTALAALLAAGIATPLAAQQPGAHFLANWDLDKDGTVTLAEAEEQRGYVFATFDADSDGVLDGGEYDAFDAHRAEDAARMGPAEGKGMGKAHMGMERAFNDADGDGSVSEAEFLAATAPWLALMDRNADGAVTSADFGPGHGMGAGKG